jgi:hypothetical protein
LAADRVRRARRAPEVGRQARPDQAEGVPAALPADAAAPV